MTHVSLWWRGRRFSHKTTASLQNGCFYNFMILWIWKFSWLTRSQHCRLNSERNIYTSQIHVFYWVFNHQKKLLLFVSQIKVVIGYYRYKWFIQILFDWKRNSFLKHEYCSFFAVVSKSFTSLLLLFFIAICTKGKWGREYGSFLPSWVCCNIRCYFSFVEEVLVYDETLG